MPPDRRAHSATLRAIRQARGYRLADLVGDDDGLSKGYLSHVENGRYRLSPDATMKVADRLHVPVDVLTGQIPPIATLRGLLHIPPEDLAAAANMSPTRLARVERGSEQPHPDELAAIARRLGVDIAALAPDAETAASA